MKTTFHTQGETELKNQKINQEKLFEMQFRKTNRKRRRM